MGIWVDEGMRPIAVMNMDDNYLRWVISAMAHGKGRSSEIVLGCVDEVYDAAKKRGILRGLKALALHRYTLYIWKRGSRDSSEPPRIIRRILASMFR